MSVENGSFAKRKDSAEIVNQAVTNSRYIEEIIGQPLIPPSFKDTHLFGSMSEDEAREQFGTIRYGILVDVMRAELQGRDLTYEMQQEYGRRLQILNNVDSYIANYHVSEDDRTLYPKQMEAFEALGRFLGNGKTKGYFKLPTAFGKTVIFSEFIKAANVRTLVVVPTIELIDQTEDKMEEFSPDTSVGKVYSESKDLGEQVTVITYQSLLNWVGEKVPPEDVVNFRPYDFDLVILDEAHHALGERAQEALEAFPQAIKLGFTATPYYDEERNLDNLLGEMIYGQSISEAVEEGILSDFKNWIAKTNTDLSQVAINPETGDYNRDQLAKALDNKIRNQAAAQLYKAHFDGDQTIVTCVSVDHARHIAEEFQKTGIAAEAIYGELGGKRKDILDRFKSGETKVLISNKLLDEGVDLPTASRLINLRPTLSSVVAEQRGGRVLRLDPQNPNKEAIIVDFVDVVMSRGKPVTFAEVAGTARMQKASGDYHRPESQVDRISQIHRYVGGVEGLILVIDVEEVMSIVNEAGAARIEYKDFTQVPIGALCEQFSCGSNVIHTAFRRMKVMHPNIFWSADTKWSRTFATEEGQKILVEALQGLHPEEYIPVPTSELSIEWGILDGSARAYVRGFEKQHPDLFYRPYVGYPGTFIKSEGLDILRKERVQLQAQEGHQQLDTSEIATQYGSNRQAVVKAIHRLAKVKPEFFTLPSAKGQPFYATSEGLAFLNSELQSHIDTTKPEGKVRIAFDMIGKEFGISSGMVHLCVAKLAETDPGSITLQGRNKPVLATPQGERALREMLEVYRLPEGSSVMDTKELSRRCKVSGSQITSILRKLREANPTEITRGKLGTYVATVDGKKIIEATLIARYADKYEPQPTENSSVTIITGRELAIRELSQNLSFGTHKREYGSQIWKEGAARYLVGMRNESGLDISEVAARMNCELNEIIRLESGEASIEEFQGDLPRKYAEAIGRPGVYDLYNIVFHIEYGVMLPEIA